MAIEQGQALVRRDDIDVIRLDSDTPLNLPHRHL
jgi:hypothetical protein